ncbi:MAG: PadR family transcriptional regulator [Candidatus Thermoplasmatota archaeon]
MKAGSSAAFLVKVERDLVGGLQHLLVLAVIKRQKAAHGYGIIRALDEATGGRGAWKEGTIYPLLATLEREGLVASRWGDPASGPRRKYYQLTPAGVQALRIAIATWNETRTAVDRLLEPS